MPDIIHEDEEAALLSYVQSSTPAQNELSAANLIPANLTRVAGPWDSTTSPWGQMLHLVWNVRANAGEGGGGPEQPPE